MNERGVEVLVDAALRGVPQIRGAREDAEDGRCAIGVLAEAMPVRWYGNHDVNDLVEQYDVARQVRCPACTGPNVKSEVRMIVHLNDEHGWDFLKIARALGPDA